MEVERLGLGAGYWSEGGLGGAGLNGCWTEGVLIDGCWMEEMAKGYPAENGCNDERMGTGRGSWNRRDYGYWMEDGRSGHETGTGWRLN